MDQYEKILESTKTVDVVLTSKELDVLLITLAASSSSWCCQRATEAKPLVGKLFDRLIEVWFDTEWTEK